MENALALFDEVVLEEKATWWQMELPSGNVFFGDTKSKMLGYSESDFSHYSDFTQIVHPDDYEKTMQEMRDHLEGKKDLYEVLYRIQHKNGDYLQFYDCGKIINREGEKTTLMGFVVKIEKEEDLQETIKQFKDMVTNGKPSLVDIIAEIR